MKKFRILMVVLLAAVASGCTSAYFSAASGSAYDDLYTSHDRTAIAERQRAEAEARRAEAEARRAEALALQAEYEAQLAQLNVTNAKSGNTTMMRSGQTVVAKQQVTDNGLIIINDDDYDYQEANPYQSFVADSYESAYARRLQGFKSASYRMPSSYFNLRYGGNYSYATAYDPAFYNVMVSGDQVWVEPRYITSMFGTWGATNATALLYSPWYYGWNGWHHYDPWYYSWHGYPRYSWYDWNWNICYGGGWGVNLWWGWGGHYHPWRPYHHHHHHHIGHGPIWGLGGGLGGHPVHGSWGGGSYYGSRNYAPRVVGNEPGKNNGGVQQGKPARAGSMVNRGSVNSTPYRSPATGATYGQSSRGQSNAAAQSNSVGRGNATSGRGQTTGAAVGSSRGSSSSRNTAVGSSRPTSTSRSSQVSSSSSSNKSRSSAVSSSSRSRSTSSASRGSATSSRSSYSSSSSSSRSYSSGSSYSSSSSRGGSYSSGGYSSGSSSSGSSGGGSRGGGGSSGGSRGGR